MVNERMNLMIPSDWTRGLRPIISYGAEDHDSALHKSIIFEYCFPGLAREHISYVLFNS